MQLYSISHTHTHTRAHTHTHTHTHTHEKNPHLHPQREEEHTHTHTRTHTNTRTRTCTHTDTHTHMHTHTHTRTRAHTHARTHACTHTRTHTRAHTHTHRQDLSFMASERVESEITWTCFTGSGFGCVLKPEVMGHRVRGKSQRRHTHPDVSARLHRSAPLSLFVFPGNVLLLPYSHYINSTVIRLHYHQCDSHTARKLSDVN